MEVSLVKVGNTSIYFRKIKLIKKSKTMKKLIMPLKRYAIIAYIFCTVNSVFAQIETVTLSASKSLEEALQEIENIGITRNEITKLSIINNTDGTALTASDFSILNEMTALSELDLSGDEITTALTDNAFLDNQYIKTVKFPTNMNYMGNNVFNNSKLEGIVSLPKTLTRNDLFQGRFMNCQGITGFEFPENPKLFSFDKNGNKCQTGGDGVVYTTYDDKRISLLLYPCGKPEETYTIPESVNVIARHAFFYNKILKKLVLPTTFTGLMAPDDTFWYNEGLEYIDVAKGNTLFSSMDGILVQLATESSEAALLYCPRNIKAETITINGNIVKNVPSNNLRFENGISRRFFGCAENLKKIIFTEGIENIGENSVRYRVDGQGGILEEIYLPSTISTISKDAFCQRKNVKLVVCRATTLPTVGNNAFFDLGANNNKIYDVYAPATSLDDYKATNWGGIPNTNFKPFFNISITDGNAISSIATDIAFEGDKVTISANEAPKGKIFDKWVTTPANIIEDETSSESIINMPAENITIKATYKEFVPSPIQVITLNASKGLKQALQEIENAGVTKNEITKLTVINNTDGIALTNEDFSTLNEMAALSELDLSGDEKTTTLTKGAFKDNQYIKAIKFPANLNNIEAEVFNNSKLEGIISLPKTLTRADAFDNRFANCQGIIGFEFPDNPKLFSFDTNGNKCQTEGDGAIYTTYDDGKIVLLLYPCGKTNETYSIPESVTTIGKHAFSYNKILKKLILPTTFQGFVSANDTFWYNEGLETIEVTEGNASFTSMDGILVQLATETTEATLLFCPRNIKAETITINGDIIKTSPRFNLRMGNGISQRFFGWADNLKKIVFTEGVETIEQEGVRYRIDGQGGILEEIYLPSTIKQIGPDAFCQRKNVKLVVCRATTLPTVGNNAFFDLGANNNKIYDVYVPATSLDDYKATNWGGIPNTNFKPFFNISITDGNAISSIATDIAFEGDKVTISANEAPEGKIFDKWVTTPANIVEDETSAKSSINMPAEDITIKAIYKDNTTTSIQNYQVDTLSLYPNPATNIIHITGSDKENYTIYNTSGSIVKQGVLSHGETSICNLPNGIYLFKMGDKTVRFIKK